jgi:hypothetical protein
MENLQKPIMHIRLQQDPGSRVQSAGIIPFAVEPVTHTIYVLLARSATFRVESHQQGSFGDLGGHIKDEDRGDPARCAAREFSEESLCKLRLRGSTAMNTRLCRQRTLDALQEGDFSFMLDHDFGTHRTVHYVVCVPFDARVHENFSRTRRALLKVPPGTLRSDLPRNLQSHPALTCETTCSVNGDYLEKDQLQWFSLDHLIELIGARGHRIGDLRLKASLVPTLRLVAMKLDVLRS